MSNRDLMTVAFAASLAVGQVEAAENANPIGTPAEDLILSKPDGEPVLDGSERANVYSDATLAELMYAGDGNVGAGPSSDPVTIRSPIPTQAARKAKTGDNRGTPKVRQPNEQGPRQTPEASKKGA